MHPSPEHAWSEICARLRRAVPEATFALWLEPLQPVEATDVALVLAAPDERRRSWATGRFGRVLEAAATDVLGAGVAVDVVV
ncbi:MAG TPA: DnaA N-terminal domain-containing protein, partial [Capillimicrobium sp.]|nr:DnaA N-terminal domain-containing protein [Capillimicrobium sp.]